MPQVGSRRWCARSRWTRFREGSIVPRTFSLPRCKGVRCGRVGNRDWQMSVTGQMIVTEQADTKSADAATRAQRIRSHGFAVFEKLWSDDEVDRIRGEILRRVDELNPPALWSRNDRPFVGRVEIAPTGLVFQQLLSECPVLAPEVLKPELLDALRTVLGEGMQLELVGAVISDETRPYFAWHTHIDGVPDSIWRREGWPEKPTVERVLALLYLDDIDDDSGVLLVHPREEGAPTAPPQDPDRDAWEGQIEVRVPRGSVVAMEQCIWHAARARRTPGRRAFLACYFRADSLPAPDWVDTSLSSFADANPLLASLVGQTSRAG